MPRPVERTAATRVNDAVEHAGRWTAARSTRRSFLGRVGRLGVLLAAGPALAELLTDVAGARVCGQSGVSPLCPTYDCDDTWGWCWYAQGCCAGGALKKICDCCGVNWPNVHGYCPSGTNVKRIVESCGTDPRLQTVVVRRLPAEGYDTLAAAVRGERFPGGSAAVVLSDRSWPLADAVAHPVAAVLGAPVLGVGRGPLGGGTLAELRRLGTSDVTIVGAALPSSLDASLRAQGFAVERVGTAPDLGPFSEQVANWIRTVNGADRTVCVADGGLSGAAAPVATSFAAGGGLPLVVGMSAAARVGTPSYLIGPELAGRTRQLPGSRALNGGSVAALSVVLADEAMAAGLATPQRLVLAPRTLPGLVALAGLGAPVVLHSPGTLDGARDWLFRRQARYGRATRVELLGSSGALGTGAYKELQSILNGFEAHRLVGGGGQGLPVIPQPPSERPIGRARRGVLSADERRQVSEQQSYWTGRAGDDGS
jgi:hypothetical protein